METYQIIKKFLADGGKCLLIEDGKPIGVVLTMEEYELSQKKPEASAELSDINLSDEIILEGLGLDEPQY